MGAIALRPSGNSQEGHFFYSLTTGRILRRYKWTLMPMPNNVIDYLIRLGRKQDLVGRLVFGDVDVLQNGDVFVDFDSAGDSDYDPNDNDGSPSDDVRLSAQFIPIDNDELADITGVNEGVDGTPTTYRGNTNNAIQQSEESSDNQEAPSDNQASTHSDNQASTHNAQEAETETFDAVVDDEEEERHEDILKEGNSGDVNGNGERNGNQVGITGVEE